MWDLVSCQFFPCGKCKKKKQLFKYEIHISHPGLDVLHCCIHLRYFSFGEFCRKFVQFHGERGICNEIWDEMTWAIVMWPLKFKALVLSLLPSWFLQMIQGTHTHVCWEPPPGSRLDHSCTLSEHSDDGNDYHGVF